MRRLILYRHAKSSWDNVGLPDFDRGLSERGADAAPRMGRWFVERGYLPDVVLCSNAVRTKATLALTRGEMGEGHRPTIIFDRLLYLASCTQIIQAVNGIAPEFETAMVIGHNPGLHAAALAFAGRGGEDDLRRLAMKYPTAAAAILEFDTHDWSTVAAGVGTLVCFQVPRGLGAAR